MSHPSTALDIYRAPSAQRGESAFSRVGVAILQRHAKIFTGPTRLRGLIGQLFPNPYFDDYFMGRGIIQGVLEML